MRIRVKFSKTGALRYIGHLDLHKMWERTTRRADLALMYSQGYHPQPKIQLASALPLGFSSRCELVDLWVDGEVDLQTLPERLAKAVPPGLGILGVQQIDEKSPPMQTQVRSTEYQVTLFEAIDLEGLTKRIEACLAAESLDRVRRGKPYNLRPLIEILRMDEPDAEGNPRLWMQLSAREGATGRPEEVLEALEVGLDGARVERCGMVFVQPD